ncbi:MAG: deoxyguanosinetriphosphate triphosphohydrolase, partial [Hyphomicrobium sp.]
LAFDGLNLTWETLEGLAKHNGPVRDKASPVAKVVRHIEDWSPLNLDLWPSAEAQVASLADDIAYLSHDVDDGLRAGLINFDKLFDVPLAGPIARDVKAIADDAEPSRAIYEVTRRMITAMVGDVVIESRRRLSGLVPSSAEDIRGADRAVIAFSEPMTADLARLKTFLFQAVYHNQRVLGVMEQAEGVVRDLFGRYNSNPDALPHGWREAQKGLDDRHHARLACDFLAGQTDRYALAEHRRLFDVTPELG